MADSERPTYLIFLTDGLPTEGVIDSQQILKNLAHSAGDNLRLFAFGVGYDVDTYPARHARPGASRDQHLRPSRGAPG